MENIWTKFSKNEKLCRMTENHHKTFSQVGSQMTTGVNKTKYIQARRGKESLIDGCIINNHSDLILNQR